MRAARIQLLDVSHLSVTNLQLHIYLSSSHIFWRRKIIFITTHNPLIPSNLERQHHKVHLAPLLTHHEPTNVHTTSACQPEPGCSQITGLHLTVMLINIQMTHSDLLWKCCLSMCRLPWLEPCLAMAGSEWHQHCSERLQACRERCCQFRRGSSAPQPSLTVPKQFNVHSMHYYCAPFAHTCKRRELVALPLISYIITAPKVSSSVPAKEQTSVLFFR